MLSERVQQSLQDIVDATDAIASYLETSSFEQFAADRMRRDAIVLQLLIASEAAIRLGDTAAQLIPDHDWPGLRGIGNYIRHAYDSVSDEIVWNSVTAELPALRVKVVRLLRP